MSLGSDPKKEFTLPKDYYSSFTDGADLVTGKYDKYDSAAKKSLYNLQAYVKKGDKWTLAEEWSTDGWSPGEFSVVPESEEKDEAPVVVLPPGTYKVE